MSIKMQQIHGSCIKNGVKWICISEILGSQQEKQFKHSQRLVIQKCKTLIDKRHKILLSMVNDFLFFFFKYKK